MTRATVLSLRNTSGRIDPFRYPADVGALADALLVANRVIVAVETLPEVLCIASWLGSDFLTLINEGTLSFFFSDGNLEPTILNGQLHIFAHAHDGPVSHIVPPSSRQLPMRNIERELEDLCATYPYMPCGFNPGRGWETAVAASAPHPTLKYPYMVRRAVARLFSDEDSVLRLTHSYSTARGIANPFPAGFRIDQQGRVHYTGGGALPEVNNQLYALLQQSQRFFASALLDAELQIAENDWVAELLTQATTAAGESRETAAFSSMLDLEDVPSVRVSVLMQEIPGREIVKLRNSTEGQRFRQWINEQPSVHGADALVRAYHQSVGAVVNRDQIWFGGLRVLGSAAVGVLNPWAGFAASVADFLFGKTYYRERWHPRVFVKSLPSSGGANAEAHVPLDPIQIIRRGAKIRAGKIGPESARLELVILEEDPYRPGEMLEESFSIDYAPLDAHVMRMFNTNMGILLENSHVDIPVECVICGTETALAVDSVLQSVACRQCGASVFPLNGS